MELFRDLETAFHDEFVHNKSLQGKIFPGGALQGEMFHHETVTWGDVA